MLSRRSAYRTALWKYDSNASSSWQQRTVRRNATSFFEPLGPRFSRRSEGEVTGDEADGQNQADTVRRRVRTDNDHVPFENAAQQGEAGPDLANSTITPREKAAFEKLFGVMYEFKAGSLAASAKRKKTKGTAKSDGLGSILEGAQAKIKRGKHQNSEFPPELKSMAEKAREKRDVLLAERRETVRDEPVKNDLDRVNELMDDAGTDLELWEVLKEHVLDRVAALGLDSPTTPYQQAAVEQWQNRSTMAISKRAGNSKPSVPTTASELLVMTANLPNHLLHFMEVMKTHFPPSLLPLNLLPTLKRLGPSASALGVSTPLYNHHIRLLAQHYPSSSLPTISETLAEMDKQVYPFDEETLVLVQGILREAARLRQGHDGRALAAWFASDRSAHWENELVNWRIRIREGLEIEAVRRSREREAQVLVEDEEEDVSVKHGARAEEESRSVLKELAAG